MLSGGYNYAKTFFLVYGFSFPLANGKFEHMKNLCDSKGRPRGVERERDEGKIIAITLYNIYLASIQLSGQF
jgi:hypothetical protein